METKPSWALLSLMGNFIVLFCTTWLTLSVGYAGPSQDIELLSSTDTEVVIRYTPQLLGISTVAGGGQEFSIPQVENCTPLTQVGKPMLPCRRLLIGIPIGATTEINVLDIRVQTLPLPAHIAPFPRISQPSPDLLAREILYIPDASVNSSDVLWPQEWAIASAPESIRHQRVIDVNLHPLRYNPKTGEAIFCQHMTVQVRFVGGSLIKKTQNTVREPVFDDISQHTLLNHTVARKWRQPLLRKRSPVISRSSGLWFRLIVQEEGIYRIDGQRLHELGVSTDGESPARFQFYYGGGRELQPQLSAETPQLNQVTTRFLDRNQNGKFDTDDALLFYAQATSGWEDNRAGRHHYINHYTNENVYYLHVGQGARKDMQIRIIVSDSIYDLPVVATFLARQFG